jgi:antitoxin MazE
MSTVVKGRIIKIGNSRGIRIPKVWLEQLGLNDEFLMTVEPDKLIIQPGNRARSAWEEQFRAMAEHHEDEFLNEYVQTRWDMEEWEW